MEGRRSNERGRASLFAQLKNLNNVNFHSISRRAGRRATQEDLLATKLYSNDLPAANHRQNIAEGEWLLKQLAKASNLPSEQGECPRRPRMNLRNGISPTCACACASERGPSSNVRGDEEMDAAGWTEAS